MSVCKQLSQIFLDNLLFFFLPSYHKFESAQSSPKRNDFSLLMENEYYSDVDTPQNENPTKTHIGSNSKSDKSERSESSAQHTALTYGLKPDVMGPSNKILSHSDPSSNFLKASKHSNSTALQPSDSWPLLHKAKVGSEMAGESNPSSVIQPFTKMTPEELSRLKESRKLDTQRSLSSNGKATTDIPHIPSLKNREQPVNTFVPVSSEKEDSKHHSANDDVFSKSSEDSSETQPEGQENLSKLLAEDSVESINLSSNTFQGSPCRPHAPVPGLEDSTEEQQVPEGEAADANKIKTSTPNENVNTQENRLMDNDLELNHQLVSFHSTKVRADSEVSSVFTEVSTRELYPHLLGPEFLSSSCKDSSSSHNDALDEGDTVEGEASFSVEYSCRIINKFSLLKLIVKWYVI